MNTLQCQMKYDCRAEVTHIGEKGYCYCGEHAKVRRSGVGERCRRMRKWEIAMLQDGKPLPSYRPRPKPKAPTVLASDAKIRNIKLEMDGIGSASLSCVGADGRRYHVWVTTVEPLRVTNGWLYCNPPAEIEYGKPGYFTTRQYPLGTRYKNMDAIVATMLEIAKRDGLLAKARKTHDEKRTAERARLEEIQREELIRRHGVELFGALRSMTDLAEESLGWREQSEDPEDQEALPLLRAEVERARKVIAEAEGRS